MLLHLKIQPMGGKRKRSASVSAGIMHESKSDILVLTIYFAMFTFFYLVQINQIFVTKHGYQDS